MPYSTFRQTVFYTPETLTVEAGDAITGTIACAPNMRNNRDLDISIIYAAPGEQLTRVNYKMYVFFSLNPPFFHWLRMGISDDSFDCHSGHRYSPHCNSSELFVSNSVLVASILNPNHLFPGINGTFSVNLVYSCS